MSQMQEQVAEELKKHNRVKLGAGYLVRIPRIPGKIRLVPKDNGGEYVEYIYDHWYDREEKQSRHRKTIIGITIEPYKDAMLPNENYDRFFDAETGRLLKEEAEETEKENEEQNEEDTEKEEEGKEDEKQEADFDRALQEIMESAREFREQNAKKKLRDDENKLRQELYFEDGNNPDSNAEAAVLHLKQLFSKNEKEIMNTAKDSRPNEEQERADRDRMNTPWKRTMTFSGNSGNAPPFLSIS